MNRRLVSSILLALLAIAAITAVGVYEYRVGVARGLSMSGKLPAAPGEWVYPHWGGYFHPFGFVFPLLLVLLIFSFARRLFWWGRPGRRGYWHRNLPADLDEWHRKAHEAMVGQEGR